ncbi:hypothetical protein ACNJX9_20030 [Bradyrhizobium sp. DASA03076]|uniref:hypothetical protein n=1 Tax=Bradyrhizobium sp. BLXBL-03 TaxID=3395916 RepID=UPI003F7187D1
MSRSPERDRERLDGNPSDGEVADPQNLQSFISETVVCSALPRLSPNAMKRAQRYRFGCTARTAKRACLPNKARHCELVQHLLQGRETIMRHSTSAALLSVLALGFLFGGSAAQARSTPVQQPQSPQQSEQSREQDRSRAEDVTIGRDWKTQGSEGDHAGQTAPNEDHQTVGRDWRAHPEDRDRQ